MDPIRFKQFCDFYHWFIMENPDLFEELKGQHPEEAWDEALRIVIALFEEIGQDEKATDLKQFLQEESLDIDIKPEDFKSIGALSQKLIG